MSRFKIPAIPPTTNKTVRFPNDVIEDVEKAISGKNCTFSAFVIAAVRAALDELKEQEKRELFEAYEKSRRSYAEDIDF